MGKKRIMKKSGGSDIAGTSRALNRIPKRKLAAGKLNILATFNNTLVTLCDPKGNSVMAASSEKAQQMGMKDAEVIIRGVGAGRESALRAFAGKGINITRITDRTPVPFNGPRAPKPRRV